MTQPYGVIMHVKTFLKDLRRSVGWDKPGDYNDNPFDDEHPYPPGFIPRTYKRTFLQSLKLRWQWEKRRWKWLECWYVGHRWYGGWDDVSPQACRRCHKIAYRR